MAYKIIWSLQARDDLREIVLFIAAHNVPAAEAFGMKLMTKADMLTDFPQIGRVVPEKNEENIREIVQRPYRIIYQIIPEQQMVAIARVWHGARGEPEIPSRLEF